jgi:hypothetical protein
MFFSSYTVLQPDMPNKIRIEYMYHRNARKVAPILLQRMNIARGDCAVVLCVCGRDLSDASCGGIGIRDPEYSQTLHLRHIKLGLARSNKD